MSMSIQNLWDNDGARQKRRIIGRGPGSSKPRTAGRGHKGKFARSSGGMHPRFEGGNKPLNKRLPKKGMNNIIE